MESSTSIITALGGGSGIDMAALAQNLATAQFQLRSARLTTRAETLDRQISAASSLKSQMLQLASALGERVRTGDLSPQPSLGNPGVFGSEINNADIKIAEKFRQVGCCKNGGFDHRHHRKFEVGECADDGLDVHQNTAKRPRLVFISEYRNER